MDVRRLARRLAGSDSNGFVNFRRLYFRAGSPRAGHPRDAVTGALDVFQWRAPVEVGGDQSATSLAAKVEALIALGSAAEARTAAAQAQPPLQASPATVEPPSDAWRRHVTPASTREREALFPYILPAHLSAVSERWRVGDAAAGARLDDAGRPAVLGVNAYLGDIPVRRAA